MRVPRPVRWLLVVVGLALGWLAGGLLQESQAVREHDSRSRRGATTAPATRATTTTAPTSQ